MPRSECRADLAADELTSAAAAGSRRVWTNASGHRRGNTAPGRGLAPNTRGLRLTPSERTARRECYWSKHGAQLDAIVGRAYFGSTAV